MKVKFDTDDNLPLNIELKLHLTAQSTLLRQLSVWIIKMLQYEKTDVSEGIDTNKTSESKECMLCHYW